MGHNNVVAQPGEYGISFRDGQYYINVSDCCDGSPLIVKEEGSNSSNGSPGTPDNPSEPFEVRLITR